MSSIIWWFIKHIIIIIIYIQTFEHFSKAIIKWLCFWIDPSCHDLKFTEVVSMSIRYIIISLLKILVYYFTMSLLFPLKSPKRTPLLPPSNTPMPGKIVSHKISIVISPFEFFVLEHVMYRSLSGGY